MTLAKMYMIFFAYVFPLVCTKRKEKPEQPFLCKFYACMYYSVEKAFFDQVQDERVLRMFRIQIQMTVTYDYFIQVILYIYVQT